MMLKEAAKAKSAKDWLNNPTGDKRKEFNFNGFTFGHTARIYMLVRCFLKWKRRAELRITLVVR